MENWNRSSKMQRVPYSFKKSAMEPSEGLCFLCKDPSRTPDSLQEYSKVPIVSRLIVGVRGDIKIHKLAFEVDK